MKRLNVSRVALAVLAVGLFAGPPLFAAETVTPPSSFVAIGPARVLDTRVGVGLNQPITLDHSTKLKVTGSVKVALADGSTETRTVVPAGATAIVANVTAVRPTAPGHVAVRPGDATGKTATANINFSAPGAVEPNSVTVALPTAGSQAGTVDLYYGGHTAGATTHLVMDIVGYYVPATSGPSGPAGPVGPAGPSGPTAGTFSASIVSSGTYTSIASVTINAPADGKLMIVGSMEMYCQNFTSAGTTSGRVAYSIDDLTADSGLDYPAGIPSCNASLGGVTDERFPTITALRSVSAGTHTVHLLARKEGGTQNPYFNDISLSVMFFYG